MQHPEYYCSVSCESEHPESLTSSYDMGEGKILIFLSNERALCRTTPDYYSQFVAHT